MLFFLQWPTLSRLFALNQSCKRFFLNKNEASLWFSLYCLHTLCELPGPQQCTVSCNTEITDLNIVSLVFIRKLNVILGLKSCSLHFALRRWHIWRQLWKVGVVILGMQVGIKVYKSLSYSVSVFFEK